VLILSLMMFWWTPTPRYWYTPEQIVQLLKATPIEREVDKALGAPTARAPGLARERELGPGSLLVFTDRYSGFPSLFWNRDFSSRVLYLRSGPDFLGRAARAGATWIFLNERDPIITFARAPGSGWQEIGQLNWINGGITFRRLPGGPRPVPAPPKAPPAPPPPPPAIKPASPPPPPKVWRVRPAL
jgi:hypothetical protein